MPMFDKLTAGIKREIVIMKETGLWKQIIAGIVTLLFGASLGFGTSQLAVASQVTRSASDIEHLRDRINDEAKRCHEDMGDLRRQTDARFDNVARIIEANSKITQTLLEESRDLIRLIRVQNQLKP